MTTPEKQPVQSESIAGPVHENPNEDQHRDEPYQDPSQAWTEEDDERR